MSRLRKNLRGASKFYTGGLRLYPKDDLYREMSFISYYFHWPQDEVLNMDHATRRRWCSEISSINKSLNPSDKKKEKSILDMKPNR
jgi:hypothetical protein